MRGRQHKKIQSQLQGQVEQFRAAKAALRLSPEKIEDITRRLSTLDELFLKNRTMFMTGCEKHLDPDSITEADQAKLTQAIQMIGLVRVKVSEIKSEVEDRHAKLESKVYCFLLKLNAVILKYQLLVDPSNDELKKQLETIFDSFLHCKKFLTYQEDTLFQEGVLFLYEIYREMLAKKLDQSVYSQLPNVLKEFASGCPDNLNKLVALRYYLLESCFVNLADAYKASREVSAEFDHTYKKLVVNDVSLAQTIDMVSVHFFAFHFNLIASHLRSHHERKIAPNLFLRFTDKNSHKFNISSGPVFASNATENILTDFVIKVEELSDSYLRQCLAAFQRINFTSFNLSNVMLSIQLDEILAETIGSVSFIICIFADRLTDKAERPLSPVLAQRIKELNEKLKDRLLELKTVYARLDEDFLSQLPIYKKSKDSEQRRLIDQDRDSLNKQVDALEGKVDKLSEKLNQEWSDLVQAAEDSMQEMVKLSEQHQREHQKKESITIVDAVIEQPIKPVVEEDVDVQEQQEGVEQPEDKRLSALRQLDKESILFAGQLLGRIKDVHSLLLKRLGSDKHIKGERLSLLDDMIASIFADDEKLSGLYRDYSQASVPVMSECDPNVRKVILLSLEHLKQLKSNIDKLKEVCSDLILLVHQKIRAERDQLIQEIGMPEFIRRGQVNKEMGKGESDAAREKNHFEAYISEYSLSRNLTNQTAAKIATSTRVKVRWSELAKKGFAILAPLGGVSYMVGGALLCEMRGVSHLDQDMDFTNTCSNIGEVFACELGFTQSYHRPILFMLKTDEFDLDLTISDKPLSEFSSLAEWRAKNAKSRDFTVCQLMGGLKGYVEDPSGEGLADFHAGRLRYETGIIPADRFSQDPVQLLRAAKFLATGWHAESDFLNAMRDFQASDVINHRHLSAVLIKHLSKLKPEGCKKYIQILKKYKLTEKLFDVSADLLFEQTLLQLKEKVASTYSPRLFARDSVSTSSQSVKIGAKPSQ